MTACFSCLISQEARDEGMRGLQGKVEEMAVRLEVVVEAVVRRHLQKPQDMPPQQLEVSQKCTQQKLLHVPSCTLVLGITYPLWLIPNWKGLKQHVF